MKLKTNIVWLKRDLRLTDHIRIASKQLVRMNNFWCYIYMSPRLCMTVTLMNVIGDFIQQSLSDIEKILAKQNKQLSIACGEADQIFSELTNQYEIKNIFSHEETGLKLTYERDKKLNKFF